MLLFKQINCNDDEVILNKMQPGDVIDLQFKTSLNREADFVSHDKQMALDMMFVIFSN